ncbi:Crossover junction endodeoxyribonuclease RuvC [compost metagenome]
MPTILAIDPGLGLTGFAVLTDEGGQLTPVAYGAIETSSEHDVPRRLVTLEQDMKTLIKEHKPDELAIEVFIPKPEIAHQAPMVLQARGIVLLLAQKRGMAIYEYRPNVIKQAATGDGRARKADVRRAVADLFDLERPPSPDDAADALAIGYTHHTAREGGILQPMNPAPAHPTPAD